LLPVLFSIYILATRVDWIVFSHSKKGDVFISSLYLIISPFTFLDSSSASGALEQTVLLNQGNEEIMNNEDDGYAMHGSDVNVEECDL
jgi:hypothetical protein